MYLPNSEQVAVYWIRQFLSGTDLISDASTSIPEISKWTKPTYVLVSGATGLEIPEFPEYQDYVTLNFLAAPKKFGEAFAAANYIRNQTYYGKGLGVLDVKPNFYPVNLGDVSIFSSPRPDRTQPTPYARVIMDLVFQYTYTEQYTTDVKAGII